MTDSADPSSEVTLPAAADLDATLRVDVRATLPAGIEQPGDMIGRYRLIEPLGQGGFDPVISVCRQARTKNCGVDCRSPAR